jgi:hypothetical protein
MSGGSPCKELRRLSTNGADPQADTHRTTAMMMTRQDTSNRERHRSGIAARAFPLAH